MHTSSSFKGDGQPALKGRSERIQAGSKKVGALRIPALRIHPWCETCVIIPVTTKIRNGDYKQAASSTQESPANEPQFAVFYHKKRDIFSAKSITTRKGGLNTVRGEMFHFYPFSRLFQGNCRFSGGKRLTFLRSRSRIVDREKEEKECFLSTRCMLRFPSSILRKLWGYT